MGSGSRSARPLQPYARKLRYRRTSFIRCNADWALLGDANASYSEVARGVGRLVGAAMGIDAEKRSEQEPLMASICEFGAVWRRLDDRR